MKFTDLLYGGEGDLPSSVATCPECGGNLHIDCFEWDSKTGVPGQCGFDVDCLIEIDSWDDVPRTHRHRHCQDEWQPVRDKVWQWIEHESSSILPTQAPMQ